MTKRPLDRLDTFAPRHLGPSESETAAMLQTIGADSIGALIADTIPEAIRTGKPLEVGPALSESEALERLSRIAGENHLLRSFIGLGYHDTITPPVILRNLLENPGWYTQYTPYQAEIAQGRLEALLNFQTLVEDLTGLPVANASLLDEATAAAEAMAMARGMVRGGEGFFVADDVHPQTRAVVETRAEALGVPLHVGDPDSFDFAEAKLFGALLQTPNTHGHARDVSPVIERIQSAGAKAIVATDLLAACLMKPPGEMGADIAVGCAQRFGVPLGFGGPHAAFLSTRSEHSRRLPGRVVGVSKDARGQMALRLAMQTREQHIRREKATSNICTAQVLLANIASMYAVYHGPKRLRAIAERVHCAARVLEAGAKKLGFSVDSNDFFDTVSINVGDAARVVRRAEELGFNLRQRDDEQVVVALDERTTRHELDRVLEALAEGRGEDTTAPRAEELEGQVAGFSPELRRESDYLTHPVFNRHHSETEMLRYLHQLEVKDLALNTSMIPLGSCTMKLNATAEMIPVTWPEIGGIHPFAPAAQTRGYSELFADLESMIADITGFAAVSLQPNAGSQGEYTGLLVIRAYHRARGDEARQVCLIPSSAHGTNPASAVMAGMKVVVVACDDDGNIDLADLEAKADTHAGELAAMMITYPSTHGVFEAEVKRACAIVHERGGRVYMDGANLNAQVGLSRPGELGADVCHLNLHKTFAIPHGGGGPGMGPIGVVEDLAPYLPGHPLVDMRGEAGAESIGPVSAAPWGSSSILPISWMYMRMMGSEGLKQASEIAILNANYMAKRLEDHYPVLYRGESGRVAHEFIIDLRPFKASADVSVDDVAKRLMDFGFHAPTMSWPVAGTMMIEPTESESKAELDRFCDAMIAIRGEIEAIANGESDKVDNPLKNAPHTAEMVLDTEWSHPYRREQGAYPAKWLRAHKFWPPVARVDNSYGDRNFVCSCPPISEYQGEG
ncbi:MAG: aminomethyl-transferring glycine dehydrogenase [Myxococcota bacterium]